MAEGNPKPTIIDLFSAILRLRDNIIETDKSLSETMQGVVNKLETKIVELNDMFLTELDENVAQLKAEKQKPKKESVQ